MKITDNTKEPKPITFADIKVGDVFKIKNDTDYYMKTTKCEIDVYDAFSDDYYYDCRNAVRLSNGSMSRVYGATEVIPVDCELVIK